MRPRIVRPEDGKVVHAFGEVNRIMLDGSLTGGKITVMLDTIPAGCGPPLHRHSQEDEIFLVASGRISYCIDDQWEEVGPGTVVFLPMGSVHCYKNVGETEGQHWILTLPSGFETFFSRCGEEFAKGGQPDMARIVEISREHGIEYLER